MAHLFATQQRPNDVDAFALPAAWGNPAEPLVYVSYGSVTARQVGTAVGVALLVPLAAAAGGPAVMTGYRIGFLGACAIALAGALSSLLVPVRPTSDRKGSKVPTVITCSSSGVVAPKQGGHERE